MAKQVVALLCLGLAPAFVQAADESSRGKGKAFLGITVASTLEGDQEGVVVRRVLADSPAARAGLKRGDVITRVDNRQVEDETDLYNCLSHYRPGEKARIHVLRGDQEKDLRVTFGKTQARRDLDEDEDTTGRSGLRYYGGDREDEDRDQAGAYLGVEALPVDELTARMKKRLGLTDEEGLVVVQVMSDSPAARAGLRHGDLITKVNGRKVTSVSDLRRAVQRAGAGKKITLEVMRGSEEKEFQPKLEEAPSGVRVDGMGEDFRGGTLDQQRVIQRLERRIRQLEKRIRDLEERNTNNRNKSER
jgi:serine protease Do